MMPMFHEPSRGIGGETDKRVAFARRVNSLRRGEFINITEDVRKYAAEQGIAEAEALAKGMEEKSKEFVEKGAEVYTRA